MDTGPEPITDDDVLAAVRRQAARVQLHAALLAVAVMALTLLLPG